LQDAAALRAARASFLLLYELLPLTNAFKPIEHFSAISSSASAPPAFEWLYHIAKS
jgi:hypothetical protein